jgi:hypothetical protein
MRDFDPSLGRHVCHAKEEDGVSSLDDVLDSLGEASKVFAVGFLLEDPVL